MIRRLIFAFAILFCAVVSFAQDVSFYRRYAEKGDVEAMYNLAMCYLRGSGVQEDYSQAVSWLTKAVKKKIPSSAISTCLMLYEWYWCSKGFASCLGT